jgi:hypothetical protein
MYRGRIIPTKMRKKKEYSYSNGTIGETNGNKKTEGSWDTVGRIFKIAGLCQRWLSCKRVIARI